MERNHMLAPAGGHREADALPDKGLPLGPPTPQPRQQADALPSLPPPTYYQSTGALPLPQVVPTSDSAVFKPRSPQNDKTKMLPSLSAVTGGHAFRGDADIGHLSNPPANWPVLNPLTAYQPSPVADSPMDFDARSNSVVSAASPSSHTEGRSSSVNLDDPDVRLAAEALGDLRADFVSSPPNSHTALPLSPPGPTLQTLSLNRTQSPQSEPLFALLTTSHPLLATTIEGASSAYGGAKNFSPRFKSGAEYVEGYLTPLANTVGSVGRVTGVEGGVRWFLGAGRRQASSSSDLEAGRSTKKRRTIDGSVDGLGARAAEAQEASASNATDVGAQQDSTPSTPKGDRRLSAASTVDTLPAYDEARSPAYTETTEAQRPEPQVAESQRPAGPPSTANAAWQSRLIMSTSGLSVAMSDESLRSLKYCLRWLRWANDHIGGVIGALKSTLEQFESADADDADSAQLEAAEEQQAVASSGEAQQSRTELAARINSLKGDVLKTLQDVINTVSKYAGGALPDNARILVRRHLTSLPQRFRVATMTEGETPGSQEDSESAMREGAQKVLVLAKEGLDMVGQVTGVLDGTIVSAEEWCERMGRKPRTDSEGDGVPLLPPTEPDGDVKMG